MPTAEHFSPYHFPRVLASVYFILLNFKEIESLMRTKFKSWIDRLSKTTTQVVVVAAEPIVWYSKLDIFYVSWLFSVILVLCHVYQLYIINYSLKNKINWVIYWCWKTCLWIYSASPQARRYLTCWCGVFLYLDFSLEKMDGGQQTAQNTALNACWSHKLHLGAPSPGAAISIRFLPLLAGKDPGSSWQFEWPWAPTYTLLLLWLF